MHKIQNYTFAYPFVNHYWYFPTPIFSFINLFPIVCLTLSTSTLVVITHVFQ